MLATRMIAAVLLAFVSGCARPTSDAPAEPDAPRIVVLSPALGAILTDLGLDDAIVGRHGWDALLDQSLPVCGDQHSLNYEAILRADPTHVLTEWGSRDLPDRLSDLADRNGWRVENFAIVTLSDIDAAAQRIEALFPEGVGPPEGTVERFRRLVETGTPVVPAFDGDVLLLMSTSPIAALGPGSAHHQLLELAGGVPALTEGSPYMTLHAEDLHRMAPDGVILVSMQPDARGTTGDHPALASLADLRIPAVEQGRVVVVTHPQALLPSPRLVELADQIEEVLRQWAGEHTIP